MRLLFNKKYVKKLFSFLYFGHLLSQFLQAGYFEWGKNYWNYSKYIMKKNKNLRNTYIDIPKLNYVNSSIEKIPVGKKKDK